MSFTPTDPLFEDQWYLRNTGQSGGTAGMDIRVDGAWSDYTGDGVRIVVIDDGVFHYHPDIEANYDASTDLNFVSGVTDALPGSGTYSHGTQVSGFLGAPVNGVGVVGVAYGATFTGYRISGEEGDLESDAIRSALASSDGFDISNNSYGSDLFDNTVDTDAAVLQAVSDGRDGLGTITVFAAGNSRSQITLASHGYEQCSPYQISVAATDTDGRIAAFSSPGANVFVAAPGDQVIGNDGLETPGFELTLGTSFSAPIVSGVAALVIEANPDLGYRDVFEILGYSAYDTGGAPLTVQDVYQDVFDADTIPDGTSEDLAVAAAAAAERVTSYPWTTVVNGAVDWNGGGLTVSHDFGLGQVDARAATRLAETWNADAGTTGNLTIIEHDTDNPQAIPDADVVGISQTVTVTTDVRVEAAVVHVTLPHDDIGDLRIELVSPHGTVSHLIYNPDYEIYNELVPAGREVGEDVLENGTFLLSGDSARLMTTQVYGESALGDWTLRVADTGEGGTGILEDWSLTLYGGDASSDDRYVFTDQYGDLAADELSRAQLADADGGTDTINASAASGDVRIDLTAGNAGTIEGSTFAIADGTVIENLYTGDGDDTLLGSSAANHLIGGRGDDLLSGGTGDDTLDGGRALDAATFAGSSSGYAISVNDDGTVSVAGGDGGDVLKNVEILGFDDGYVAAWTPTGLSEIDFDAGLYLAMNPDVEAAGYTTADVYDHYLAFGADEGRAANAFFDTGGYLAANPDVVAAGVNPLQHYAESGWLEGRDPSVFFDTAAYLAANPDVAAAGLNPLDHFLRNGIAEGRMAQAAADWIAG
ncbi:S8 family serine peptidase [Thalassobaculum sp.]|uniref:S8 family serine peptidase n=1 Tax=Thalassobaculum sp. TaxID=2022740 RepID=UPI0032ECDDF5